MHYTWQSRTASVVSVGHLGDDIKLRTPAAMDKYRRKYAKEIAFYQFQQYLFQVQWEKLKTYANDNGIKIIGDIPLCGI